jgi:transposase
MKEQEAYEAIKELAEHGGNKERAALVLGCTRRSINRHIAGYKAEGKAYFIHGNRGRRPAHALDEGAAADIAGLYANKYDDANFAHFTELLREREGVFVSESTVRNILGASGILSPKAARKTRREFKAKLKAAAAGAKTAKERERIEAKIVAAENAHPRRSRSSRFGEMIQMDASLHLWFGDRKATLHLAADDAAGTIVGAWFEWQETLRGYYNVLRQILTAYGIPYMFYTDKRTVFEYRKSGSGDDAGDSFTQFGYACKQLGIQIKTTSVPQAKGRIERLNGSMQSRLPAELRLEGVTTIEQANEYLPQFIAKYNARFALDCNSTPSVFETQPSHQKIDLTLAVLSERTVDCGHSIRLDNKHYRTLDARGLPVHFCGGTKGLAIRSFSGDLFFAVDDMVFALEEIPLHERASKNFDPVQPPAKPRKQYIPPPSHPWRRPSFSSFVQKQPHRSSVPA